MRPLRLPLRVTSIALITASAYAGRPLPVVTAAPDDAAAPPAVTAAPAQRPIVIPDPPNTQRVSGPGWSAAIPTTWTESPRPSGDPLWISPLGGSPIATFGFTVQTVHSTESLDAMAASLQRQDPSAQGATLTPRRISRQGHTVHELEVQVPPTTEQVPVTWTILVRGRQGMELMCIGPAAPGGTPGPVCRQVFDSAWVGSSATATPAPAAAGMRWHGARGRYVQVPESWPRGASPGAGGDTDIRIRGGGLGAQYGVRLHFLDDLTQPARQVFDDARHDLTAESGVSFVRQRPVRRAGVVGVEFDVQRRNQRRDPSTVLQWTVQRAPGAYLRFRCVGTSSTGAPTLRTCRDVLETLRLEGPP